MDVEAEIHALAIRLDDGDGSDIGWRIIELRKFSDRLIEWAAEAGYKVAREEMAEEAGTGGE